jgi:hypothetical protein
MSNAIHILVISPMVAVGPISGFMPGYPTDALSHAVARNVIGLPTCAIVPPLYKISAFSCVTICVVEPLLLAKFAFVLVNTPLSG